MSSVPIVLTIAGFDPSSGAGATADLKTISAFGCYGTACLTAITVQNTRGVFRVKPVTATTVRETLALLSEDLPPAAVKVGMLGNGAVAEAVADYIELIRAIRPELPVVIDPVLRSSSGANLLDQRGVLMLRGSLLQLATIVTPNVREAETLTGIKGTGEELAHKLRSQGACAVVVTGGDESGDRSDDTFAYSVRGMEMIETLSSKRIETRSTHGTGCAFSTAIACGLALGQSLPKAVTTAKQFVTRAIAEAPGLGRGNGPLKLDLNLAEQLV